MPLTRGLLFKLFIAAFPTPLIKAKEGRREKEASNFVNSARAGISSRRHEQTLNLPWQELSLAGKSILQIFARL